MKTIFSTLLVLGVLMMAGCQRKEASDSGRQPIVPPPSWPRQFFQPTGAKALVWYQVYGLFPDAIEISSSRYRCGSVPQGIEIANHRRADEEKLVTEFLKNPFFAAGLKRELPQLAGIVETAPECTIIRREVPDSPNLDYLRDTAGIVMWFFDNGALAVLDPQTMTWYDREKWRSRIFDPNGPVPKQHVVILYSEEKGGADTNAFWFHTRGMRKFARPDLSVHDVPAQYRDAVIDLLNRLVEAQAFGGVVANGEVIRMSSLPPGIVCHPAGTLDDPDFNNTHIEIGWPK